MSSSMAETSKNIKNAFDVVRKTYENLYKLFSELDAASSEQGFVPITPGIFLRYRSDPEWEHGWMIQTFIKLFQSKDDEPHPAVVGLRQGPIYGVSAYLYKKVSLCLARYEYDLSSEKS